MAYDATETVREEIKKVNDEIDLKEPVFCMPTRNHAVYVYIFSGLPINDEIVGTVNLVIKWVTSSGNKYKLLARFFPYSDMFIYIREQLVQAERNSCNLKNHEFHDENWFFTKTYFHLRIFKNAEPFKEVKKMSPIESSMKEAIKETLEKPEDRISHVLLSISPSNILAYYEENIGSITELPVAKKIIKILEKYDIAWHIVDTVTGAYDLNRPYIEFKNPIPAVIEYSGVVPLNWDIDDIYTLTYLNYSGEVMIHVNVYDKNGTFLHENA
jgi:hypothetical protein